ncbi:unnamed protein product [Linum tenue]|uniref:Uncharacterized protein n=1 Tax=Linum tenue TaxID=586396 RepID=A0AAV0HBS7_9ROSI|nr:unnamed protein product [Linum tenue]
MKIFNRFRKLLVRLLFSVGEKKGGDNYPAAAAAGERADPPKTSCSSYYSTQLHYSEAIADCIEFLNKAAGSPDGPAAGSIDHPDVWV